MSETDDLASSGTSKKGGTRKVWGRESIEMDGAVEQGEEGDGNEKVESDGDMEEAGGMDE